jgi:predicted HTH domain antitoxin
VLGNNEICLMSVQLPSIDQDILDSARLTAEEAKVELAVYLYRQRRLSLGKARELAGMSLWIFRQLLASRQIPPHYDEDDLIADVETLRGLQQE